MADEIDTRVTPSFHADTVRAIPEFDDDTESILAGTVSAFTEAYIAVGRVHDAREAGKTNPAWNEAAALIHTADFADKLTLQLAKRMLENADGIVDMLVAKAMEGDTNSASLILSRIMPSIKAQSQRVAFDFDHTAPVSAQVEQVLAAIADASVPADIGRQIIDAISSLSSIRANEELEARIAALEEKQG